VLSGGDTGYRLAEVDEVLGKHEGTIQLFVAATCPFLDISLQQIDESYLQ